MGRRTAKTIARILLLLLTLAPAGLPEEGYKGHSRAVVHRVQPVYPEIARRLSLEGLVMVRAEVAGDGHVKSLTVVSGNAILAQAAVRAVENGCLCQGQTRSFPSA